MKRISNFLGYSDRRIGGRFGCQMIPQVFCSSRNLERTLQFKNPSSACKNLERAEQNTLCLSPEK
jgi:hypothetical protein